MAPRIHDHVKRAPRTRLLSRVKGYFFPGEAARILGLDGIDYHQLRRILRITSGPDSLRAPSRKWTRFTFKDLLLVRRALDLAGGIDALKPRRHLRLKRVQEACTALRDRFDIADPLTSANLRLDGRAIVAQLDGVTFEPATGQTILEIQHGIRREITQIQSHLKKRLDSEAKGLHEDRRFLQRSKSRHRTVLTIR